MLIFCIGDGRGSSASNSGGLPERIDGNRNESVCSTTSKTTSEGDTSVIPDQRGSLTTSQLESPSSVASDGSLNWNGIPRVRRKWVDVVEGTTLFIVKIRKILGCLYWQHEITEVFIAFYVTDVFVTLLVPLLMAYITRYIFGTDKLRPNAFEVRGMNGSNTGVIQCSDLAVLSNWIKLISDYISVLTSHKVINL